MHNNPILYETVVTISSDEERVTRNEFNQLIGVVSAREAALERLVKCVLRTLFMEEPTFNDAIKVVLAYPPDETAAIGFAYKGTILGSIYRSNEGRELKFVPNEKFAR